MDNHPLTFLVLLLVCISCSEANINADVILSEFCVFESCPLHRLACPNDTRIVIFGEQRAFQYADSVANDTCTEKCSSECCQSSNFQCFHPVSKETFSHVLLNCWEKENCSYRSLPETRVFTDNMQCENGSSLFGELAYDCVPSSSIRDFTDPSPAHGKLLMASFDSSSVTYPPCVSPNVSLECQVENADSNKEATTARVMLVMNATLIGSCPKLHVAAGNKMSPVMSCKNAVEFVALEAINLPIHFTLTPQDNNPNTHAWAVVKGTQPLNMTCGKTCSQSTAAPETSTPQSTSVSTMEARSSPTDHSLTSMSSEFSSTPTQSSSESTSTQSSSESTSTQSNSEGTSHPADTLTTGTETSSIGEHSETTPAESTSTSDPSSSDSESYTASVLPTGTGTVAPAESTSTFDPSSSESVSQTTSVPTTTLRTDSINTEVSLPPQNVGAIVGGVIGSLVLLIIIIAVVVVVCRRQQGLEPKAAAREPEHGHAVANSAYEDWDLDSGDGEGGTAHGSSPSVLPPKPAPAQRPVTDVYAKVNKKTSRMTPPPSPDNTSLQPGHLPTCLPSGEVTDLYSRPKKGGKRQPDNGDNSDDVTGPEDSSSPPVIPPRRFRSSEATGNKMADNNTPEDHLAEYDHLGQKRRHTPQSGDVTYGHLGNKMAAEDPEASYDRLRGGDKRGAEPPGPAVLSSHVYGRLGTEGASEEGDKGPYDRLGGAGRRDVIKDGVYHVVSEVDIDPYSEHEPNVFEDE